MNSASKAITCHYKLKGNDQWLSYQELMEYVDLLDIKEWSKLSDIVFSVSTKQSNAVELLIRKSKEYSISKKNNAIVQNGEANISEPNTMNVNEFLESDSCLIQNEKTGEITRIVTQWNEDSYRENYVAHRTDKNSANRVSMEEAVKEFERIMKLNDIITEDAMMLHSLLTDESIRSIDRSNAMLSFEKSFRSVATSRFIRNPQLISSLYNGLKQSYIKTKGAFPSSRAVHNINLRSKLNGISKDLIGHIDHLYVDLDGTLHLYNFKVTSQHPNQWPSAKVEKYKALLVALKYMLAENGFDVLNMDMSIIPVQITYNEDATSATGVRVLEPIKYSSTKNGTYALTNYDIKMQYFLKDNYEPSPISNNDIVEANNDLERIFPELNIKEDGIKQCTEDLIRNAPNVDISGLEPIVIEDVHLPNHGYNVIIRDTKDRSKTTTIEIKSNKPRNKNKEIYNVVKENVSKLHDNKSYELNAIKTVIKEGHIKGNTDIFADLPGLPSVFLKAQFGKYFEYESELDAKGKEISKKFKWELLEDLSEANVLMFKNRDTNQVDVISLSAFNLNQSPKLEKGSTILGSYRYDTESTLLKGDFGNIELMRIMTLLNRASNSLIKYKLGNIKVINTRNQLLRSYSASYLNRNLFSKLIKEVNHENEEKIANNLEKLKYIDEVGVLIDEYNKIVDGIPDAAKDYYELLGFDKLTDPNNELQEYSLYNIMENIYNAKKELRDEETVIKLANSGSQSRDANIARLLLLTSSAYQSVRNEQVIHKSNLNTLDTLAYTALTVPDLNIRIVSENLLITHDAISSEFMDLFYGVNEFSTEPNEKSLNLKFEDYFDAIGYSRAQGLAIGNEAQQFSNFYERDEQGNNLMIFKNPYSRLNDSTYLTDSERTLLKHVLFAINNITTKGGLKFNSPDSPGLQEHIKKHKEYFWVPLSRASNATTRLSLKAIKDAMKYKMRLITNSKERLDDALESLRADESEILDEGFKKLLLYNTYSSNMPIGTDFETVQSKRKKMLIDYGSNYFETNLKNIMIDYLFKSISTELYNKFLISTKSLLLNLHLTADYGGNLEVVDKEINHIKDYLKVNVFLRSIMEDRSKKIMSLVTPIKSKVTNALLMGNVVSMFRDTIQGVLENTTRSIIKLNTDITPNDMRKAYLYVTTHATSDARAVNILSKLCLKYRLSNTDVSRISERAKSSRNGIFNWDNWAYGTLRSPDFLNRMTLFVAKAMHDGCWEAWSIDENNNLKYDWKKDKRFNLLASEDTSNMDAYISQRELYFSKIREYNQDHPNQEPLDYSLDTNLPTPYSNQDILSIRSIGDNIYGSYDKSKKGMYENWALGISFGMFTTWFNGIYNNYFGQVGQYSTNKLKQEQDTDPETGQLLYFNRKTGQITTEAIGDDGSANDKVFKNVPIITQGIFPTIGTLWRICRNEGYDEMKKYLNSNESERLNLRKLLSDLLIGGLFALLFKGILSDSYNDYKKDMKNQPLFLNLIAEVTYKSSSRSYDSFLGPVNIIQQLGDNMNPPYYSVPIKLIKDTYKTVFGDKQVGVMLADNFGLFRSYADSYRAETKK